MPTFMGVEKYFYAKIAILKAKNKIYVIHSYFICVSNLLFTFFGHFDRKSAKLITHTLRES